MSDDIGHARCHVFKDRVSYCNLAKIHCPISEVNRFIKKILSTKHAHSGPHAPVSADRRAHRAATTPASADGRREFVLYRFNAEPTGNGRPISAALRAVL